jgi:hypothetical protein
MRAPDFGCFISITIFTVPATIAATVGAMQPFSNHTLGSVVGMSVGAVVTLACAAIGRWFFLRYEEAQSPATRSVGASARPRDQRFRPVAAKPARPGGRMHRGRAEMLRRTVPSFLTGEPCLIATLTLQPRSGQGLLLRDVRSAEFGLQRDDGERLLVRGELWLEGPGRQAEDKDTFQVSWPLVSHDRVAREVLRNGEVVAVERLLMVGARVEVTGDPVVESAPELAYGYREHGQVQVLSGNSRSPVLVRLVTE